MGAAVRLDRGCALRVWFGASFSLRIPVRAMEAGDTHDNRRIDLEASRISR